MGVPITVEHFNCCDWSPHKFLEANFFKLMDSNQIFRIDFVSLQCHHRVDNISLREMIGSKNFALINLSLNFSRTTIYDKVFLENLVAVH